MAAALQALRSSADGFTFHVSVWTFVALAARSRLASRMGTALLLAAGVGGFLYPLRFVPANKMGEITIGLSFAVCALTMVAFLLWRLKLFFEADNDAVESKKN